MTQIWEEEIVALDATHEVTSVLTEIDERVGPRNLATIAVVTSESQAELRRCCSQYGSGEVFVETEHSYAVRIRTHAGNNAATRSRLCIVVSPKIPTISLQIPSQFRRVEIVACTKPRSLLDLAGSTAGKELVLEEGSKYCNVPLAQWNCRSTFPDHELLTGPGVAIELPDDHMLSGEPQPLPFAFEKPEDVDSAAQFIEKKVVSEQGAPPSQSARDTLPWIALATGSLSGIASAGAVLVSSIKVTASGLFISAGPYAASFNTITASASVAVVGGAIGTGTATGVAVAAVIYFIPWAKLGSWLVDAFDRFVEFLKSIWNKIVEKLGFLKTILSAILKVIKAAGSGIMAGISSLAGIFGRSEPLRSAPMKLS